MLIVKSQIEFSRPKKVSQSISKLGYCLGKTSDKMKKCWQRDEVIHLMYFSVLNADLDLPVANRDGVLGLFFVLQVRTWLYFGFVFSFQNQLVIFSGVCFCQQAFC